MTTDDIQSLVEGTAEALRALTDAPQTTTDEAVIDVLRRAMIVLALLGAQAAAVSEREVSR